MTDWLTVSHTNIKAWLYLTPVEVSAEARFIASISPSITSWRLRHKGHAMGQSEGGC